MKTKKISWQAIAIVVLALVLIASIALGVSGAWFQDNDAVQQTSKMGEAVTIRLGDTSKDDAVDTWSSLYTATKPFPGDTIMGHTAIYMGTETKSVVRGKIAVSITKADGTTTVDLNTVDKTVTDPGAQPDKSADKYYIDDGVGGKKFDSATYEADLATWKTAVEKYDLKLLASMLDVTLAGKEDWKAGKDTTNGYYYYNDLADNTKAIELFDALKLDTALSNSVAEWTISVKVSVEAIQAANLCDKDGVAVNTEWFNDLPDGSTVLTKVKSFNADRNV